MHVEDKARKANYLIKNNRLGKEGENFEYLIKKKYN